MITMNRDLTNTIAKQRLITLFESHVSIANTVAYVLCQRYGWTEPQLKAAVERAKHSTNTMLETIQHDDDLAHTNSPTLFDTEKVTECDNGNGGQKPTNLSPDHWARPGHAKQLT